MSNAFLDAFIAAAAGIPTGWKTYDSGTFGSDIACGDDTDALFSEDDGTTARAVALVAWRLITSDRGSIPDAPGRGFSICSLLRRPATAAEQRMWPSLVEGELLADERIASAQVLFAQQTQSTWTVQIDGVTSDDEPFSLIGELTPTTAILKEIIA